MLLRFIFLSSTLVCTLSLSGCCSSPGIHGSVLVREDMPHLLIGRWATILTDQGFWNVVLVAEFDNIGGFTFTKVGPLPQLSVEQKSGSQPVNGVVDKGRYEIRGNRLYLNRPPGEGVSQSCSITMQEGVLVLTFDEYRTYALTRLDPEAGQRNK
jgi:hypothetical protein